MIFLHIPMAPCSVVPSTSAVPTKASDSEYMNNSGDESTQEYLPETTDAARDSDVDDIETDWETATTVPGNVKPLLHQRHSKEEHAILINGKVHWMGCKGSAHKKVFLRIASELRKLLRFLFSSLLNHPRRSPLDIHLPETLLT